MEYRMVLQGGGDGMADVVRFYSAYQGSIVSLCASGGKENL